jgi:hypothetical protein
MWTKGQYKAAYAKKRDYCKKWLEGPWWFQESEPVARFTGYVGLFTLVLAIVAGMQTWILSNQLTEMRDDKRPWVGVEGVQSGPFEKDKPLKIEVIVKNTGRTPALNVTANFTTFGPVMPTDPKSVKAMPCSKDCITMVLWPNGTSIYTVFVPAERMTESAINLINNKQSSIIIEGRIDYLDVADKPHKTIICNSYAVAPIDKYIFCAGGTEAD